MPSRTPIDKHEWPLLSEKVAVGEGEEKSKKAGNRVKEYNFKSDVHLGCYQTVRAASSGNNSTMSARNVISPQFWKNKSTDGLTAPLTAIEKNNNVNKKPTFFENAKLLYRTVVRDWIFLALLGFIMASFSFAMDFAILNLQNGQMLLYELVESIHILLALLVWVGYVVVLTMASALFAHYIAVQAIGSGIPEMKTILRGVILKEYLSLRTLISKMVGLTLSLGSGLPMGKEGPFVHIAAVVASQLSRLVHGSSAGIFVNETRSAEMLAAGCAVGVACTFSAPIGGVLFSIEVTSVYFAVRNYWRGFFAATCSATLFRILKMFSVSDSVTVEAHYQTNFPPQNAFMPQELPVFALIGLVCGILGSTFVYIHRRTVLFLRRNSLAKLLFQKNWLVYPFVVAFFISSLSFPLGLGQFMGGQERFSHTMKEFFINCTWTAEEGSIAACPPPTPNTTSGLGNKFDIHHWKGPNMTYSPFLTLTLFQVVYFFCSILASTLPVPSGIFMPVFVLGAAFGRMVGEGVYQWFPNGFIPEDQFFVRPGIYAVVGAAAFCGAVTHTVSVAVIVFELTGQLCHLLPVMIAVLIANATASYIQPSIYDSIIRIKNLPYLPDIPHTSSLYHQMLIEQFMVTPIIFIAKDSTIGDVKKALEKRNGIRAFPLVDSLESLALVGSVSRFDLQKMVDLKIGTKARHAEATRRVKQKMLDEEEEKKKKDDDSNDSDDDEQPKKAPPARKASRFLVVPVIKNGAIDASTLTKRDSFDGLTAEDRAKILTDSDKKALFDAVERENKRENDGRTIATSFVDNNHHHTISDIFRSITHLSFGRQNFHKKSVSTDFELYGNERKEWEDSVLDEKIDLDTIPVDSTPFQLINYTSLFKAHSLFSLLGLNRAYVTMKGQLIGVVSLKEIRSAIEYLQAGNIPTPGLSIFENKISNSEDDTDTIRNETGAEDSKMHNAGFLADDNGEDDAHEDYIQPPVEILRKRAVTPSQEVPEPVKFEISSPSTNSSCVSIEMDSSLAQNVAHSDGLLLSVPDLPPRSKSADEICESRRIDSLDVQIRVEDEDGERTKTDFVKFQRL